MQAYVEHLCDHCGIVRVGPVASGWLADFDYSTTYRIEDGKAVIKGFFRHRLPKTEFELIVRTINEASGLLVAYDRAGPPLTRVVQRSLGLTAGKIVMDKIHPVDDRETKITFVQQDQ